MTSGGPPARLRPQWWHASGGVVYHLRALRWQHTLWRPFAMRVNAWLTAWAPPCRQLVIIGASAGYTLDQAFLNRFAKVTVLEPDPLARWLLRRRFVDVSLQFGNLDCFATRAGPHHLVQRYPNSAYLFANVIGQIAPSLPPGWHAAWRSALQNQHWASYHDVIATQTAPQRGEPEHPINGKTLEEVLTAFWSGGELAVYDHTTFRLAGAAHDYAVWHIAPDQHQLVEWYCFCPESCAMTPNSGIGGRS